MICLKGGLASALVLLALASTARADLVVAVQDLNLAAGGSGYVEVLISYSGSGLSAINQTSFQFQITTTGSTLMAFTDSPNPASDPTFQRSNYVFAGSTGGVPNSGDVANGFPLGSAFASSGSPVKDQFSGGDFFNASGDATVTSNQILAELPVTAATGVFAPNAGDRFTISLVGSGTSFMDSSNNSLAYTSTPGTVSISAASPEPGSLLLTGFAALSGFAFLYRRKWLPVRSCASKPSPSQPGDLP
jgi:hypothetical protein